MHRLRSSGLSRPWRLRKAIVGPGPTEEEFTRPFEIVSRNLEKLGCMPAEKFLSLAHDDFDDTFANVDLDLHNALSPPPIPEPTQSDAEDDNQGTTPASRSHMVARLHQTCQRVFGSTEALKFEFLEENGANSKQCILSITRPNGLTRSYTTQPIYARKNEAKAQAAAIAIDMGAVDFIIRGEPESSKHTKGVILAPLYAPSRTGSASESVVSEDDPSIQQIEECCKEWRAARVQPFWIPLNEAKAGTKQGVALKIELSPHSTCIYSVGTTYDTVFEAKKVCANLALEQGVLDFIKYGNGQTEPAMHTEVIDSGTQFGKQKAAAPGPFTLQSFYETLPRPFPENFGGKSANEINAPAWLNQMIQSARGARLSSSFNFFADSQLGLHGCVLRLESPGESKSYLVDTRFAKRADAKAAVCLQAISQGIGAYIRAVGQVVDSRITPMMRKWATERIFPMLGSECHKIQSANPPKYEFERDRDAYGCTLTLELSDSPLEHERRQFTVDPEYRTKLDAKVAVGCRAVHEGAYEFIRYRGQPAPPGHIPFISLEDFENRQLLKRKDVSRDDSSGTPDAKRQKVAGHIIDTPMTGLKTGHSDVNSLLAAIGSNSSVKEVGNPHRAEVSGSGGPGSSDGSSKIYHPKNHDRPGNRKAVSSLQGHSDSSSPRRTSSSRPLSGNVPVGKCGHAPYGTPRKGPPSYGGVPGSHGQFASPPPLPAGVSSQTAPYAGSFFPLSSALPSSSSSSMQPPFPTIVTGTPLTAYPRHQHGASYSGTLSNTSEPSFSSTHPSTSMSHSFLPYGTYPEFSHPHSPVPLSQPQPPSFAHQAGLYTHESPLPLSASLHESPNYQPQLTTPNKEDRTSQSQRYRAGIEDIDAIIRRVEQQSDSIPQSHPTAIDAESNISSPSGSQYRHRKDNDGHPTGKSKTAQPETTTQQKSSATKTNKKSYLTELHDYCKQRGLRAPRFDSESLLNADGTPTYKVWVIVEKERLELPVTFSNVTEGQERLSKQVLVRLRGRAKKQEQVA